MLAKDRDNPRAKEILRAHARHVTTDHVVVETWLLLKSHSEDAGMQFWERVRTGAVRIEFNVRVDLERAWQIKRAFPDQDFSIVDCTSFAAMERLRISRAASFDRHFTDRYGSDRDRAFEILS